MERGGIEVIEGSETCCGRTGLAKLEKMTSDPAEAIADADVIMITVRAQWHGDVLDALLPCLKDGQIILFNTGYWGSLRVAAKCREAGLFEKVTLAESNIMPYLSKKGEDIASDRAGVYIIRYKRNLKVAAFPGKRTRSVYTVVKQLYAQSEEAPNVLATNLAAGGNPSLHIPFAIPIAGYMFDRYQGCHFYGEATIQGARLVDAFDRERISVARALGCKEVETAPEAMEKAYGYTGKSFAEALRKSEHANSYILAGTDFASEDVCFSLIPLVKLGESLGIPTPVTRAMVEVFGVMMGRSYWESGIALSELGFSGLTAKQIERYVMEGSVGGHDTQYSVGSND